MGIVAVLIQQGEHHSQQADDTAHDVVTDGMVHQNAGVKVEPFKHEVDAEVEAADDAQQAHDHIEDLSNSLAGVHLVIVEGFLDLQADSTELTKMADNTTANAIVPFIHLGNFSLIPLKRKHTATNAPIAITNKTKN